jgi:predicted transcriptional regulator of viral defense system
VECFRVAVNSVPKELLGETMAALTKLGFDDVDFELVTTVKTFRNNNAHGSTSDLLLDWIKDHPTFKAIEAVKHFETNGHTRASAYPAMGVLVEKGVLKKLGEGMYSRADVKHLEPPRKSRTKKKVFEKTGKEVILALARRSHGRFTSAKIVELFLEQKRARNSVSTSIDALMKQKLVKRVGEGSYALTAKAQGNAKKPAQPEATTTETAHG